MNDLLAFATRRFDFWPKYQQERKRLRDEVSAHESTRAVPPHATTRLDSASLKYGHIMAALHSRRRNTRHNECESLHATVPCLVVSCFATLARHSISVFRARVKGSRLLWRGDASASLYILASLSFAQVFEPQRRLILYCSCCVIGICGITTLN